jgi:hypothetical protein
MELGALPRINWNSLQISAFHKTRDLIVNAGWPISLASVGRMEENDNGHHLGNRGNECREFGGESVQTCYRIGRAARTSGLGCVFESRRAMSDQAKHVEEWRQAAVRADQEGRPATAVAFRNAAWELEHGTWLDAQRAEAIERLNAGLEEWR